MDLECPRQSMVGLQDDTPGLTKPKEVPQATGTLEGQVVLESLSLRAHPPV
jgi:hypothetical protein